MATKAERIKNFIYDKVATQKGNPFYYHSGMGPKKPGDGSLYEPINTKAKNKKNGR